MIEPGIDLGTIVRDPSLRLPERTRFVSDLARLEGRLRKAALAGYAAIFGRAFFVVVKGERRARGHTERKEALDELEGEVEDLRAALRSYLAIRIDPRIADQAFRPVPITLERRARTAREAALAVRSALLIQPTLLTNLSEMLAAGGAHFSSLFRGQLLGKAAAEVDRLEAKLAPEIADLAFASERMMAQARASYELWFRLVRVSLATVVVRAVPYEEIWRGVYGTAGYRLSFQVEKLSGDITASPAWGEVVSAAPSERWISSYVSLGTGDRSALAFPIAPTLEGMRRETETWRNTCKLRFCTPASQGTTSPFEFDPIPPALHSNPALAGPLPDHMFARQVAQERVAGAARHWDWLKREVLQLPAEAIRLRINAGSLEHGGAHPPHATHRNGSMFDLGLGRQGEFPVPTCSVPMQITISEPVIRPESARDNPSVFPTIAKILEALKLHLALLDEPDDPEDPGETTGKKFTFCATDFEFPRGGLKSITGSEVSYADVALRFTQAMLLTFPSQILYARWETLRDAQADLVDRIAAAEAILAKDGRRMSEEESTALTFFKKKLGRRPPVASPSDGSFGVLFQREDHADHWHLSYRPDDVEVSDSARDTTLRWLEQNRSLLWPARPTP
jgi:hypothetical protein